MARILIGKNQHLRRLTERWQWLRNGIWRIEAGLFSGFMRLARRFAPDTSIRLGRRLFTWLGPYQAKHKHVRRNLQLAFPDKSEEEISRLSARVWGNMGAIFAEYAQLQAICTDPGRMEVVMPASIKTLRDTGRQAVFVSAHFCNWEILAAAISREGIPVTAVYTPLHNPRLDELLAQQRKYLGCKLIARDESMRPLIRELAAGRSIGLVMDQRVDSGAPVPMFGIDKLTTLIPARLALRRGCELVPMNCERLPGGKFRITFFGPVAPDDPDADEMTRAVQMSRKVNEHFESWIRERPTDWFCTKRRWAKDAVPRPVAATEPIAGSLRQGIKA